LLGIVPLFGFHAVVLDSILTDIMNREGIIFEIRGRVGVKKKINNFSQIRALRRVPNNKIIEFVLVSDAISLFEFQMSLNRFSQYHLTNPDHAAPSHIVIYSLVLLKMVVQTPKVFSISEPDEGLYQLHQFRLAICLFATHNF
jgi:hypothetical protein